MTWVIFSCGLMMIVVAALSFYSGFSVKKWRTAIGKVVVSEVGVSGEPFPTSPDKFYYPTVIYEYHADGNHYRSRRLGNFLLLRLKRTGAESIVARFPRNSEVKVYYHPWYPSVAALMPGVQQPVMHLFFLSTGLAFSVLFGLMLYY